MKVVTHIPCESEYMGLSESGIEAMYLTQLQGETGVGKKGVMLLGVLLEAGNEPCVPLALHAIHIKFHSFRDRVEEGLIEVCKIATGLNVAYMLTKHVGVRVLKTCKALVGMSTSG